MYAAFCISLVVIIGYFSHCGLHHVEREKIQLETGLERSFSLMRTGSAKEAYHVILPTS